MATNPFFNLYKSPVNEQDLYKGMHSEAIQIYGQDVQYIIREIENEDFLFHEDILSSFSEYYTIEMYMENFDGFEGSGDFVSQFGFQIEDQMLFNVNIGRFQEETGMEIPNEGDLIYLPVANALFEIKHVEDEEQYYPLGTQISYKIKTELFRYGHQDFDTGIDELDALDEEDVDDSFDPFDDGDSIETAADGISIDDSPFGNY